MKKDAAANHLRTMMVTIQKFRSNNAEVGASIPGYNGLSEDLMPWIFGDKCPIGVLAKALEDYENTGDLSPHFFANMMYVAINLQPEIAAVSGLFGDPLPEHIDVHWYVKFDE